MPRKLAAAAVTLVAALAFYRWCYLPWRCNLADARLLRQTTFAMDAAPAPRAMALARSTWAAAVRLLDGCPCSINLYMIAAANDQLLGQDEHAVEMYSRALHYDRRPELFLQLGLAEWRLGRRDQARQHLTAATAFNPELLLEVAPSELRVEVSRELSKVEAQRANELHNAEFRVVSPHGPKTQLVTTRSQPMNATYAAAAEWGLTNNRPARSTTELLPSTRASDRIMMHVKTSDAYCGVFQAWQRKGTGPAAVRHTMWLLVRSGRVMIGTGDSERSQQVDQTFEAAGKWQLVNGRSTSCPANQTVIYAIGGPAEFYIESPVVRALPGETCLK